MKFLKKFDEVQKRTAKSKLVLPLVLAISLLSTNWSCAETLVQLRNRVDTFLTNKVSGANGLVARQNAYLAANGRYWQGLITHSVVPVHLTAIAGDAIADRLIFKPTDQAEAWSDFLPEWNADLFAAAAKIDVYDGPAGVGKGWTLHVIVKFNGIVYERRKTFGSSTNWDFAWRVMATED